MYVNLKYNINNGCDNMKVLKFKSFEENEINEIDDKSNYLQNYLSKSIKRFVKVDFLVGDNTLVSKEGILKETGNDYIVLEMVQSNDLLVCDIYSIKFVQII